MDSTTEVASGFTVADYDLLRPQLAPESPAAVGWSKVREVFRRRIKERFLQPIEHLDGASRSSGVVPGFAILALDCLLIDTLQSFREGRVTTGEVSPAHSFKTFLKAPSFAAGGFSSSDRDAFFHYVRNGLLHNGETRGDWKVRTDAPTMLTRSQGGTRTLNRRLFHDAVIAEFEDFSVALESGPASVRENFLRRMDAICGRRPAPCVYYFAYGSNLVAEEIRRDAEGAKEVGVACLAGWRVRYTKHSQTRGGDAASIESSPSSMVWGYLYLVTAAEWDKLVDREQGYNKLEVKALYVEDPENLEDFTVVNARTFVGNSVCNASCGPTADYRDLVIQGAEARKLPKEYIAAQLR